MEAKENQGQNKKEGKGFHGPKKSTGYLYLVLTSVAKEIGEAYQETLSYQEHQHKWQVNTNPAAAPAPAKGPPLKHSAQPHMPGLPMYGHPVGPLVGHVASAVGTPVMLPPLRHHPNSPYVAYPMAPPQTISHLLKISPEDTR
ncbi:hypothetical protein OIU77_008011 [Salix suchowensis]|uniref:Uncharacterized protein n=1 Tax=Salix suchowensis TaxID=1278906 RepID=A0ABQ9AJH1_9ROSI|nr:hypothetical protein OIU77_008011 [Salix suchowensis]